MEALIPFFVLVILFMLLVFPVLAIVAIMKGSRAESQLEKYEQQLAQMRKRLWKLEKALEESDVPFVHPEISTAPPPIMQPVELTTIREIPEDIELTAPAEGQEAIDEITIEKEPIEPGQSFTLEVGGKEVLMEPIDVAPTPQDLIDETEAYRPTEEPVEMPELIPVDSMEEPAPEGRSTMEQFESTHGDTFSNDFAAKRKPSDDLGTFESAMKKLSEVNIFVSVGLIVLFAGLAFLLKYAFSSDTIPNEIPLAAVALTGMGITFMGWKLRKGNTAYALLLQGGGVAITYLTVFAALKMFHVIPPLMALILMSATGGAAVVLAVAQNALSLAMVSIIGGFMAPLLASSGSGNHVILFSYYLLLNLVIFGIANYRPWRILTIAGFWFTFVISTFWGVANYKPELVGTTAPFLISYWALYIGLALFYALRQPPKLRGITDGTILFGTPVVAFTLLTALMREIEFGIAFSSLGAAIVYCALAYWLKKRNDSKLFMLAESFLVIGILFATLAIPFGLSDDLTIASWALEGLGILWVALKYKRIYAKWIGLTIQYLSFFFFLGHMESLGVGDTIFINSFTINAVLIGAAMLFSSYWIRKTNVLNSASMFLIGTVGLLAAGTVQLVGHLLEVFGDNFVLLFGLLVFYVLYLAMFFFVGRAIQWKRLYWVSLLQFPVLLIGYFAHSSENVQLWSEISGYMIPVGIVLWFVQLSLRKKDDLFDKHLMFLHGIMLIFITIVFTREGWLALLPHFGESSLWQMAYLPLFPMAIVWFCMKAPIPLYVKERDSIQMNPGGTMVFLLFFWSLVELFFNGTQEGMGYLPILSPLDIVQLGIIFTILIWWKSYYGERSLFIKRAISTFIFLWANAMVLRTISHYTDISYDPDTFLTDALTQSVLTIFWTLYGTAYMIAGTQLKQRPKWIGGASLLGMVTAKLIIDVVQEQTLLRIATFISVGVIFMLVGYFSPFPQKQKEDVQ